MAILSAERGGRSVTWPGSDRGIASIVCRSQFRADSQFRCINVTVVSALRSKRTLLPLQGASHGFSNDVVHESPKTLQKFFFKVFCLARRRNEENLWYGRVVSVTVFAHYSFVSVGESHRIHLPASRSGFDRHSRVATIIARYLKKS
jgi:hypothetical protein